MMKGILFKLNIYDFSFQWFAKRLLFQQHLHSLLHLNMFPHILCNVVRGYNKQDGVFTAPMDEVYVFFCKITKLLNSHDMCFQFILNGYARTQNLVYGRSDHAYRTSSNLIVLQLIRGDRDWIRMYGDQSFSGYCCSIVGHFLIYHSDWPPYIWPIYLRISCIIYSF